MIDYNTYPLLLHTSFAKDDAPAELPFEVASADVRNYLSDCKGYQEMFAYIAIRNTVKKENSNTHYYLNDDLFHRIDGDDRFRNDNFRNFFLSYVKPKNGVILFKDCGQYLYVLLGVQETKKLKRRYGRYIAVALFKGDFFIGFEEGYITDSGIQVEHTGHYENGMDIGGYISFVLITLGFAGEKELQLSETTTIEKVYTL